MLEGTVRTVYDVVRRIELYVCSHHASVRPGLLREIVFVTSEELYTRFPELAPREREE